MFLCFNKQQWGMYQGDCWLSEKWSRWCIDNRNIRGNSDVHRRGVGYEPYSLWFVGDVPILCLLKRHRHQWFWQWPYGKYIVAWNILIRKYNHLNQHGIWRYCSHGGGRTWWMSWWVGVVDAMILWNIQRGGWWWHQQWRGRKKFLTEEIVEEAEVGMEASVWIKVFYGNIWLMG